jgi:hypothetical protein
LGQEHFAIKVVTSRCGQHSTSLHQEIMTMGIDDLRDVNEEDLAHLSVGAVRTFARIRKAYFVVLEQRFRYT